MSSIKMRTTPAGMRDLLFEECAAANTVERTVTGVFEKNGYQQVMTPGIEYYDVFERRLSGIPCEQLYKLVDREGEILVLRPDSTLPIARMVGSRLKENDGVLRLYYNQSVFRVSPAMSGRLNEVRQAGIELIGSAGIDADIEVITTAVEALRGLGLEGFRIELGHAGFFKALVAGVTDDPELRENIRLCVEAKNYSLLSDLIDNLPGEEQAALRALPRLFGGEEVFKKAKALIKGNAEANEALAYLKEVYDILSGRDAAGFLSIDLGLVQRNDYYTGLVFGGYIEGSGLRILSGGRYDGLLGHFGESRPATGFAIETSALIPVILSEEKKK